MKKPCLEPDATQPTTRPAPWAVLGARGPLAALRACVVQLSPFSASDKQVVVSKLAKSTKISLRLPEPSGPVCISQLSLA